MPPPAQNPELYLKPGANVYFEDDTVVKTMHQQEFEAYQVLHDYADELVGDELRIVVPQLLSYDHDSQQAVLSYIGDFQRYSPMQYFGDSPVFTPEYTRLAHDVAQLIRHTIPVEAAPADTDYEIRDTTGISSIKFLNSGLRGSEPAIIQDLVANMTALAEQSQPIVESMPLYASHRDPNPNNMHVTRDGSGVTVALVDWETFGVARVGYDEGRLMSHLALDESAQSRYAQQIDELLPNHAERVYFWRVTANRCIREAISFTNGLYDSRLLAESQEAVDDRKDMLAAALARLATTSLTKLETLTV